MRGRVLVVDDSQDARALIAAVLEADGYTVSVARDGGEALARARRIVPDMVLLDASMPVMDGFEVCARMQAEQGLAAIPVIFMTGLTASVHIVRGFRAGGTDYVTKPIQPDELLARMAAHCKRARA
jgi:DNA-binding response OmpR family regulator